MHVHESSLSFNVDSSHLRIGLRVYFTALFLLLAFVGDKCCNTRVKVRLMKQSPVKIPIMTGWLSGFSAAKTWIVQRELPAGWLGIVMIAAEIMSFGSDLLVSGTVRTVQVPGRCLFGTGIVIPDEPVSWRSIPDFEQKAYKIVNQAQVSSEENGSLRGIYRKTNAAPNFRADPQDVLGYWNCVDIQHDVLYENLNTTYSVTDDLIAKGYLYNTSQSCSGGFPDGSWDSLVAWSTSVPDEDDQVWDVKASVDVTDSGPDKPKNMRSYHCTMNGSSVEWILAQIDTESTFSEWCLGLRGLIGGSTGPRASNITSILASTLEAMVMIGWGGEVNISSVPEADVTQGCLVPQAIIPWPLFTLLVVTTIGGLFMLICWIILLLQLRSAERLLSSSCAISIRDDTPNGLVGWMAQAIREHRTGAGQTVKAKDIRHWNFSHVDEGRLMVHPGGSTKN